jgi:hydrophobic/amphiphilic exporter-1 (mainly G- bacteria), HAE1 family
MIKKFIERPVLSSVVSIIILILGVLGINSLPTTQYPEIAPPTVQVSANFPGANAATVLESVIVPIEEQINGVEGMTYITSTASNNGSARISVFFEQGVDPDIASVNVQNRVARANALLPSEVIQSGVITQKQQTSALMFLTVYSENEDYDGTYIQNYLNINVLPELKRITGVGDVSVFGAKDYAMRIWLKPEKLAAYQLEPSDVSAAIREQSREAAAGSLGQNDAQSFEYVLTYSGRYNEVSEYENIVIKSLGNGKFLTLKDVADVEMGAQNYGSISFTNGNPGVSMAVYQTAGSNAQEIIQNIHTKFGEMEKDFPKGVKYIVNFDSNEFLEASISKVITTLIEAFILVFIVVFLFLQDFRSTLIPAIAVPVSIIGTFFFLNLFGYSINLLTLFALVLAIGIVVDDAIVVVEAVHAKLEEGTTDALKATHSAMDEITGAIISITLVMAAVFIPVTFITGPTGVFYEQFGVTLIVAIVISAVNALTLSPALCAIFLKSHDEEVKKKNLMGRFFSKFNTAFTVTTNKYVRSLGFLYKHKWITGLFLIICVAGIVWASNTTPTGFVPDEDRGLIFANIELPAGASLDRTVAVTNELGEKMKNIPGVSDFSLVNGFSIISGAGSNYGISFIKLDNWTDRKDESKSVEAITGQLFQIAATIPDARILFFQPPSVPGFGISSGFEMKVLDRAGGDFNELSEVTQNYLQELMKRPEIMYAQSSFNTDYPQYEIDVNIAKAKEAGISVSAILTTLQGYIGSIYTADFSKYGKQYRVFVQALPEDRATTESLNQIFVRNAQNEMAPITEFISLKRVYGPQSVTRFNLFTAASVNGAAAPGYSTGDAIKAVQEVSENSMPQNYSVAFSGLTREEISAGNQTTFIFILVILFVYFILAAQYESFLIPFSVILSVPIGVAGAYLVTKFSGLENNIYFQIALVMLIGLLAKNAILIVEFAIQRRKAGFSRMEAAFEGAKARLRPILMTSFAFIVGLLPLVFASGIGARGNNAIGTGAVGGLLIGTIFGVFVIPILYIFFQWLQDKMNKTPDTFVKKNEIEN